MFKREVNLTSHATEGVYGGLMIALGCSTAQIKCKNVMFKIVTYVDNRWGWVHEVKKSYVSSNIDLKKSYDITVKKSL